VQGNVTRELCSCYLTP